MTKKSSVGSLSVSQYRKEEDRVTAEFLKIIHYGGHDLVAYLFGEDFDLPSNDISVESQIYGGGTRPDGRISSDCRYTILVESKIHPNSINMQQLKGHLKHIADSSTFLLYITPDEVMPKELENLYHVFWRNWWSLLDSLEAYVASNPDRLLEYLVAEFRKTIEIVVYKQRRHITIVERTPLSQEGKEERVIIVGGRWGEDVALKYNVYVCQPNRFFHPARYMAFCFNNRIKYLFKIVDEPIESIVLTGMLPDSFFTDKEPHYKGDERKVYRLEKVKEFTPDILNDAKDKNGKPCAFVQRQRYTTLDKINNAKKTSDL